MSGGLLTIKQLQALRKQMARGYDTEVKIYARTTGENVYSDDAETLTLKETTKGWLRLQPDNRLDTGLQAVRGVDDARLFLPVGTSIERGDQVEINGDRFTVFDTNADNTWKVTLRVSLRRLD